MEYLKSNAGRQKDILKCALQDKAQKNIEKDIEKELETSFEEYLASMDDELSGTKVGRVMGEQDTGPVSINMNLAKNILESFSAQQGLPGPASSIITSLGARLPKINKDESLL